MTSVSSPASNPQRWVVGAFCPNAHSHFSNQPTQHPFVRIKQTPLLNSQSPYLNTKSKNTMSQQLHQQQDPLYDTEDYDFDYFGEYDDYGDFSVNHRGGGGGGGGKGNSKSEKRQAKRGGGCANVYSSKHIRAMESQRASRK